MTMLVRRSNVMVNASGPAGALAAGQSLADAVTLVFSPDDHRSEPEANDIVRVAGAGGAEVFVQVQAERVEDDISTLVRPGVNGIALTGAETAEEIRAAEALILVAERKLRRSFGSIEILLILSSPRAVWSIAQLVRVSARVRQVSCDETALARSFGVAPQPGIDPFEFARGRVVIESIAAGRQPIASPVLAMCPHIASGPSGLLELATKMKNLGFKGMVSASPCWAAAVNDGFTPTPAEVEYSSTVRRVFAEALAAGRAAVGIAGKMIDVPVDKRAQMVLELAAACTARDTRKRSR
jgi:citrate lyase subunit beta / citryl-CoA lyase